MKLHLITFVLAAFALNSCGSTEIKNTIDEKSPFSKIPADTFWQLVTLEGKDYSQLATNGRQIGFMLNETDNTVSGFSGCNNFFGTYKFETGNRINFSSFGATKMACPDSNFSESQFLNVFQIADNYTLSGNILSLNVGRRAPLAVFSKVEKPSHKLTEKYWKLKKLNGKRVRMDKNQEQEVFMILKDQDNRVTGFAGCNNLIGSFAVEEENVIKFTHMATTRKSCPDAKFKESELLEAFERATKFEVNRETLKLVGPTDKVLAEFEVVYLK